MLSSDERRNDFAQVIRADANIPIGEDEDFVPRFAGKARELVDLSIRSQVFRPNKQTNPALRKLGDQSLNQGNCKVRPIIHRKMNFVIGIVLAAETRIVFVAREIHASYWFQKAHRRSVIS